MTQDDLELFAAGVSTGSVLMLLAIVGLVFAWSRQSRGHHASMTTPNRELPNGGSGAAPPRQRCPKLALIECSRCGHITWHNRLSDLHFVCTRCNSETHITREEHEGKT